MKTHFILIAVFLFGIVLTATAQIDKMRKELDDAMVESEEGLLTLRFSDAETGNPVSQAAVDIAGIGKYTSDGLGIVRFPVPEKDGTYAVHVEREGYITVDFPVEIVAQTIFYNRFSLSKKMPVGQLRIVLEWDKKPADLDAHFEKEGGYHISYRDMTTSADGVARLDRDDRDGYGPETITVKHIDDRGKYRFLVHDYSDKNHPNATKLSDSKANVKVYGDNKLLNTFQITPGTEGIFWQVFTIEDGQVNPVNMIGKTVEP